MRFVYVMLVQVTKLIIPIVTSFVKVQSATLVSVAIMVFAAALRTLDLQRFPLKVKSEISVRVLTANAVACVARVKLQFVIVPPAKHKAIDNAICACAAD